MKSSSLPSTAGACWPDMNKHLSFGWPSRALRITSKPSRAPGSPTTATTRSNSLWSITSSASAPVAALATSKPPVIRKSLTASRTRSSSSMTRIEGTSGCTISLPQHFELHFVNRPLEEMVPNRNGQQDQPCQSAEITMIDRPLGKRSAPAQRQFGQGETAPPLSVPWSASEVRFARHIPRTRRSKAVFPSAIRKACENTTERAATMRSSGSPSDPGRAATLAPLRQGAIIQLISVERLKSTHNGRSLQSAPTTVHAPQQTFASLATSPSSRSPIADCRSLKLP
jgi:hypothetical protein